MLYPFVRHRLAIQVQAALFSLAVGGVSAIQAAEPVPTGAVQSVRQYDIAAGSLTEVLSRFASEAGAALSFDASKTATGTRTACMAAIPGRPGSPPSSPAPACAQSIRVAATCWRKSRQPWK